MKITSLPIFVAAKRCVMNNSNIYSTDPTIVMYSSIPDHLTFKSCINWRNQDIDWSGTSESKNLRLSEIPGFEERNYISINVFRVSLNGVIPIAITTHYSTIHTNRHYDLLFVKKKKVRPSNQRRRSGRSIFPHP